MSMNIFDLALTHYIVIPVNCVGVMGGGLALQYKEQFPSGYNTYKQACHRGLIRVGQCFFIGGEESGAILFPTKDHYKDPSKLEWIKSGMEDMKRQAEMFGITKIAMPRIGCGLGGLAWKDVKPIIDSFDMKELVYV